MSEDKIVDGGPVDPDAFQIITLVISAVGALGTLAQGYAAFASARSPTVPARGLGNAIEDVLRRSLFDAIRDTEDLIKLLARQRMPIGIDVPVLGEEFEYGSPMLLDRHDFSHFQDIYGRLSSSSRSVNDTILSLFRVHPGRAQEIGMLINLEGLNPTQNINQYFRGNLTMGQVLDSALESLKAYQRLLDRVNRQN
ncbi:hypothetical protein [Agrobacterium tumefaciens]|uniref:hypothetical protein n=1 Tax=Agrobacterium tumefaciens TaxID=358 RepID=UPI0021CED623|nr:hypothetical protein [Agrobacterium tumefaciens]UXS24190.1 hypothetical protein FY153_06860 [Agrobacterium tumefaciens]UXS52356.1 hypothetical protein FY148_06665 [Agrobacterium tumefaciens]UXS62602.1 hypothetical protein FY147_06665 [Agrobacterium tumefaciens]